MNLEREYSFSCIFWIFTDLSTRKLPCLFNRSGKYDGCRRTLLCKPSIVFFFFNNSYASHVYVSCSCV